MAGYACDRVQVWRRGGKHTHTHTQIDASKHLHTHTHTPRTWPYVFLSVFYIFLIVIIIATGHWRNSVDAPRSISHIKIIVLHYDSNIINVLEYYWNFVLDEAIHTIAYDRSPGLYVFIVIILCIILVRIVD